MQGKDGPVVTKVSPFASRPPTWNRLDGTLSAREPAWDKTARVCCSGRTTYGERFEFRLMTKLLFFALVFLVVLVGVS
jgi:hypothetical protein